MPEIHSIDLPFIILAIIYYVQIGRYYVGLRSLKPGSNKSRFTISVIIPARNEEAHIGACIESILDQKYPDDLFDIHVVDDHSTDNTAEIVERAQSKYPGRIHLHKFVKHNKSKAYKKAAIGYGIENSSGEIIVTTDADCRVRSTWLTTLLEHFDEDVGMVCGFILFDKKEERTLFHRIQSLEFLALVSSGAGSLALGQIGGSFGANLAYRRSTFLEVDGFRDIDHLPSGDDDLLMQKILQKTKWRVRFAPEEESQNYTSPAVTLRDFMNQRIRWASKSTQYPNKIFTVFLVMVYVFYAYLLLGVPYSLSTGLNYVLPIILWLGKWAVEFLVVYKGSKLTGRQDLLRYFPLAQIFQIPYILFAGFMSVFGSYNWKGRRSPGQIGKAQPVQSDP